MWSPSRCSVALKAAGGRAGLLLHAMVPGHGVEPWFPPCRGGVLTVLLPRHWSGAAELHCDELCIEAV